MHDASNMCVHQDDTASHKKQNQCSAPADRHDGSENTRSSSIDVSDQVARSHSPDNLHFSGHSVLASGKTSADLDPCCVQCRSLLEALNHLTAMEVVLDGDLRSESYEPALHSVWLARQACERARRTFQQTFSVAPKHLAGRCVALRQYHALVNDLDVRPLGEDDEFEQT